MKAIRVEEFGEPEVMRLVELPDLKASDEAILVRIHAAGVNPVEIYIRAESRNCPTLPAAMAPGSSQAAGIAGAWDSHDRRLL